MNSKKKPIAAAAAPTVSKVPRERQSFKALLLSNPNYFGNLVKSPFKPVKKIVAHTQYEELTCVGFNPAKNLLEATIAVKLPFGYGGNLCMPGTTEYVRFFLDYGSGWEDGGLAGVKVHDIPTEKDCADQSNKPLIYVAALKLDPKTRCCDHAVLPKVHAILSWEWVPPAGPANVGWLPPWGNTLDCTVQIKPHPWNIFCIIELLSESIKQKIKVPPLFEATKLHPIPLPDPPPFTLAEMAKQYGAKPKGGAAEALKVEAHRFGVQDLHATLGSTFDLEAVSAKKALWESLDLDWAAAIAALGDTSADVSYEELECLGLDETLTERLVATFRIKRPTGYSGDLCHAGSQEYVAFWADWDDQCKWTYLGTAAVNVHDIKEIPKEGLCYSAILQVDLSCRRRPCDKPKIGRVRAVLSWAVPPSTVDPDQLNYYGNRLDAHVQINPGEVCDPNEPKAKIRNIGGIPVEDILTASTGLTKPGTAPAVVFAHNPAFTADGWGLGRSCPFGGQVKIEGNYWLAYYLGGYYYRVKVHKIGDPYFSFTVLADSFLVERSDTGFDLQISSGGFFKCLDPAQYSDIGLAYWNSAGDADALWDVQLDIATAPNDSSIIDHSPWYCIRLDNTAPFGPPDSPLTMDIHIDPAFGGDCKDIDEGTVFTGTFIADDPPTGSPLPEAHFGGWSLATEPNSFSTPSNQPTVTGLLPTDPAPAPGGHSWKLDTGNPIKMKPCGYVIRLDVKDRSILHSLPGYHNLNHIEVGFCLREKS
jgi:hypothetical protein